jgi:hypothetical protein
VGHEAVKQELLVRSLDAWAPAALHGHKRVTYVHGVSSRRSDADALAALRVFAEFADLLEHHTLTMVLWGPEAGTGAVAAQIAKVGPPAGLVVTPLDPVRAPARPVWAGTPVFAWLDHTDDDPAVDADPLTGVAAGRDSQVLLALPAARPVPAALSSLAFTATVDLVDGAGYAERVVFAAPSAKVLEKYKDGLWALDEYAGIRYRDPHDPDGTLLDISLRPNVGPLRRALLDRLAETGPTPVRDLRTWTVRATVYRAADALPALQALVTAGAVTREPATGRLTADTVIARHTADAGESSDATGRMG